MGRRQQIEESKKEIESAVKKINENNSKGLPGNAYSMSRVNFFQNEIIITMMEDLSERLQLVETALGLIASGQKKDQ